MTILLLLALVGQDIEFVSSAVPSGADRKLVVSGELLYSACERGLDIFDISEPESIRAVGHYDTPGLALGCAVEGNLAFVADNYNGLVVLDVSDPSRPQYLSTLAMASIEDVVVRDSLAFCGSADLAVVNVADPANPVRIGFLTGVGVKRSALYDTLCLVATQQGLAVVSVADPTAPRSISTVETGWLRDVEIQGSHAFVCGDTELVVVDLETLTAVGRYDGGYLAFGLAVRDSIALLCRGQQLNVHVVNVADPANPRFRGSFSTGNGPQDAAIAGHYGLVGNWSTDLLVADVADPGAPVVRGRLHRPGELNGAWRDGDLIVTADRWYGMSVVDVSDIEHPVERGEIPLSGWPRRICLRDSVAYCANYDGLALLSVADPDNPALLGQVNTPYYTYKVALKDTLAFVAEREWNPQHGNLQVVSVADPRNPHIVGTYATTGGGVESVAYLVGQHCYVVSQGWSLNEFAIVSVADPTQPYRVSGCDIEGYPIDVDAVAGYAYVLTTSPTTQLVTVSIADTANPYVVNELDLDYGPRALFVHDPYLFVSYYYEGIGVFDLADPSRPVTLDRYNTTGNSHGMYVDENRFIYLADAHSLQVLRLAVNGVEEQVAVRPQQRAATVARGKALLGTSWTGMARAFDAAGRAVANVPVRAGEADLTRLSSGVYLLRDETGREARVVKVR